MKRPLIPLLFLIAFLIRLLLIPAPGFEADMSFWKSWGLAVRDFGIVAGLPKTNFNYPTPWGYVLAVMVDIYAIFKDPHNFNEFWSNTNLLFLAIAKSVPIIADFGIAALFLYIGKNAKKLGFPTLSVIPGLTRNLSISNSGSLLNGRDDNMNERTYALFALVYLFSPLSLFDGALWGQVDSLGIFILLSAIVLLLKKKPFLAGMVYMLGMMTKLQNMIYGPVFFLFSWQFLGWQGLINTVAGATLAFFGLNIEFFLAKNGARVFESITGNYDYFPWLSLNAYNPWWIFSGARGMASSDKIMAVGMLNAKTLGLITFSSWYLFTMVRQFLEKQDVRKTLFESLILVNGAFFLFQTQSHDRYAFPIAVFLLLWFPFVSKSYKLKAISYIAFTIIYFYNLHNAMIVNYPHNGIAWLTGLNTPTLTICASIALTALFCLFVSFLVRSSKKTAYYLLLIVVLFIAAVTWLNTPVWAKQPVYLTKFTPISATAGYASRQVNMPANASFGFDKWGYLSDQYAFYRYGIGTHAPARETYDINRLFTTLSTDMGVDTNGGPQGSVVFQVWGDGKQLYDSGIIKRFDLPKHADIPVTGVKTLELIVTDGGNGNIDDHADWLNPKLIP